MEVHFQHRCTATPSVLLLNAQACNSAEALSFGYAFLKSRRFRLNRAVSYNFSSPVFIRD